MNFLNKYKRSATFTISGDVDRQIRPFMDIISFVLAKNYNKKDLIVILYDTDGGCVHEGTKIVNILKELQKLTNIVIINTGYVASMGVSVFMAIKHRFAFKSAKFMIHHAQMYDAALTAEEAIKHGKGLKKINNTIYRQVVKKLKLTKKQIDIYNKGRDLTLTASEAFKSGLAEDFETFKKGK